MNLRIKDKAVKALFAFSVCFFNVYIYMIQKELISEKIDYVIVIFNTIALTCVWLLGGAIISNWNNAKGFCFQIVDGRSIINDRAYIITIWLMQMIGWLPIFLAYFPGLFAYDAHSQICQYMAGYSTHHPLAHTLYLQFFYYVIGKGIFRNYTIGIALATIFQMIVFSAMLAYVHLFLKRAYVTKWIRYLIVILTILSPIFSLLGISMTKDIFFAGNVAVLFTALAYNIVLPQYCDKRLRIIYIIATIGTILFRNNGIYPVIILNMAILIRYIRIRKGHKLIIDTISGLLLGIAIAVLLQMSLGADKGSANEALSLPYQQIACAYTENIENLSEEDKNEVKKILPDVEGYRVDLSDPIKGSAQGTTYLQDFVKLYFKFLIQYPDSYVRAFVELNAGYLSITDVTFAEIYGTNNRQGIFLTDTKEGFDVFHVSYFPALERLYETLYTKNKYENIIGLNFLCSPALYFWILVGGMLCACTQIKELLPLLLFMLVLLMTIFAGPCALVRYALPYIICTPVMWAGVGYYKLFEREKKVNERKNS